MAAPVLAGEQAQRQRRARATPIGTLTKKIQRQLTLSTMRPPSVGPEDRREHHRDRGDAHDAAHPLRAGGVRPSSSGRPGSSIPPPTPWRTRKRMSWFVEPANPQSTEPAVKSDEREDVDVPGAEAPRRPAGDRDHGGEREHVARQHPLDVGERGRAGRARASSSATLTIVVSRIDMIEPSTTTRRSARRAARCGTTCGTGGCFAHRVRSLLLRCHFFR